MSYRFVADDWFSQNVGLFKNHFKDFKDKDNCNYLEIGVWEGRSSTWILDNILTGKNCTGFFVDPWLRYDELNDKQASWHSVAEENFDYNMTIAAQKNDVKVVKLKMKSAEALRQIDSSTIDFAYIDGSHSAPDVLEDVVTTWRVLRPGGIVVVDDITYGRFAGTNRDPALAVAGFCNCHKDDAIVRFQQHSLVLEKK